MKGRFWQYIYPPGLDKVTRANYRIVQVDGIGICPASAAERIAPSDADCP